MAQRPIPNPLLPPEIPAPRSRAFDPASAHTLIFERDRFPLKETAVAWAYAHGFTVYRAQTTEGGNIRLRVRPDERFDPRLNQFHTINLEPGVSASVRVR